MLHSTLYNGPKIDELLDAISHIKTVVNGWVKLESTEEYPTNLNKLLNPGNFSTDYWTDSPTDTTFSSPLKVIVTKEKNLIRQYIFSTGYNEDGCTRTYNPNNGSMSAWESVHLNKGITVVDIAPSNPKDNDLWINTSNTDSVIQYYDEALGKWMSLNPYDYMDPNIYNPNHIDFTNIFKYIDEKVQNVSGGEFPVDFSAHIKDTSIHMTPSEKETFDNKMTDSNLLTAMQTIAEELNQYIATEASESSVDIPAIEKLINDISTTLTTHMNDTTIHPTQEQIDDWNSKADKEHTHSVDTIELDVSNVIGSLSIDQIPDDAKERQVTVTSEEELLALTVDEVQNGDFVYINYSETKNEVVIVVDQTKLGTRDAFISYHTPSEELKWENVKNKPTTIEELGITDMDTNDQVDSIVETTTSETEIAQSLVDSTLEKYSYANNERIKNTHILESSIDSADYKLTVLNRYVTLTEDILSKLEAITQ